MQLRRPLSSPPLAVVPRPAPGLLGSLAVGVVLCAAVACDAEAPSDAVYVEPDRRVNVITEEGASVWFIDTGTNIAIVELTPDDRESVVEPFIVDGASARELFMILAPPDADVPELLTAPRADRALDTRDRLAYRAYNYDGLYSTCPNMSPTQWRDFVESAHSGYDQYFHVTKSQSDLSHDSYYHARRYYATMCAVHTHTINSDPDDAINYEGWRRLAGGTWVKLIDQDVPQGVRLRHWDDPGSDGWQWRVAVRDVPPARSSATRASTTPRRCGIGTEVRRSGARTCASPSGAADPLPRSRRRAPRSSARGR